MNGSREHDRRSPAWWSRAVCVLGLLAGVLAMHGLAPGGHTGHIGHTRTGAHAPSGAQSAARGVPSRMHGLQDHDADPPSVTAPAAVHADGDGDCGGGHARHSDPTCVSGAVSGGPVLPALVPDPVPAAVRADAVRACAVAAPDGARAPPSLAELQLLRI